MSGTDKKAPSQPEKTPQQQETKDIKGTPKKASKSEKTPEKTPDKKPDTQSAERGPKQAHVVTPPVLPSPAYKQFRSSQPLSSNGVKKKKTPQLYGEMPTMGHNPHHSCHYQHQYYSPPSPPIKRISEYNKDHKFAGSRSLPPVIEDQRRYLLLHQMKPKSPQIYERPDTPVRKVSELINTPRFHQRPTSPRPGPNQYYPGMELVGPQYSFGQKLGEKDNDGGRTSWEKAWFASNDVWKVKTHYEDKWPEIGSHNVQLNCLGKRLPHLPAGPSPSFGTRVPIVGFAVKGKKHPSPNTYDISKAERQLFGTQPSYTMVRKDYLWEPWVKNKNVPGPGSYAPNKNAVERNTPAYSFAKPSSNYATIC